MAKIASGSLADLILTSRVKPRTPNAIKAAAERVNCEPEVIAAIVQVEAAGDGYDATGKLDVLFEKHKFWKHLPKSKRAEAQRAGLARPNFVKPKDGGYKDQPTPAAAREMLVRAMQIDETAALMSASYGAGQVLGEHAIALGWPSVQAFVADMCESEDSHIEAMVRFLEVNGLADEMRARDFDAIARVYNGPANVKTYGGRMRSAFRKLADTEPAIVSPVRAGGLRIGSQGYRVGALQKRLTELGYAVNVDDDFGAATRRAVISFQAEHGLEADGVVGPATEKALDTATASPVLAEREKATTDDLRKRGSAIVEGADKTQALAVITAASGGAGAVAKSGLLDNLGEASGLIAPATEFLRVVGEYWWIGAVMLALGLIYYARTIRAARVEDHRTGRTI